MTRSGGFTIPAPSTLSNTERDTVIALLALSSAISAPAVWEIPHDWYSNRALKEQTQHAASDILPIRLVALFLLPDQNDPPECVKPDTSVSRML